MRPALFLAARRRAIAFTDGHGVDIALPEPQGTSLAPGGIVDFRLLQAHPAPGVPAQGHMVPVLFSAGRADDQGLVTERVAVAAAALAPASVTREPTAIVFTSVPAA